MLSGLSGSGKSTALHALEDSGYFCVDNLPAPLFDTFLRLAEASAEIERVAIAMDVREGAFYPEAAERMAAGRHGGHPVSVLYIDASDEVLVRRFKETRRRHPLIAQGSASTLTEAIALERAQLRSLKRVAKYVIDTTALTVHDLKRRVRQLYGDPTVTRMGVHLVSFGFRHGLPAEADFIFDVRFLANPHYVEALRPMTGLDAPVADFVLDQPSAQRVRQHLMSLLTDVLPEIEAEGRAQVTIAVGCTGGHHRSVAMVEALHASLAGAGLAPVVTHRDIER